MGKLTRFFREEEEEEEDEWVEAVVGTDSSPESSSRV